MIINKDVEKGKEVPFNLSSNNINKDLILFKDDVLKDIKFFQKTVSDKLEITNTVIQEKLELYDNRIKLFNEKIIQLTNLIVEDKAFKDKVDQLYESRLSIKDNILINEIKLTNLEKEYNDKINNINQILSDTVIYPSVIGGLGKFKTFHEFIDYIITQISKINIYREKNTLDLNSYKNKIETLIKSFQFQLDNIIKSNNEFTTKSVNACEERIKNILLLYDDRIKDVRVENQNYAKNIEQYYKDLKEEFKKFINLKNNIYNRFNNEIYYMKKDNLQVVKIFGNYKRDFNIMKDRLTKLSEFIKDVRFRINIGQEIKRREFINMSNQIDFTKKQSIDTTSGIKKYINGEINAEELTSSKRSKMSLKILKEKDSNLVNDDMINNYIFKNRIFENDNINDEYSSRNSFLKNKESFSSEYGKMPKRMSVNYLINPFSQRLYKNISQKDDLFEKKNSLKNNYSNEDINNMEFNFKQIEKIGKKRNTTFIGNSNLFFKLENNINHSQKFIDDSPRKRESNIIAGKTTIKEEEEINSKKSQSSSSVNSNMYKKEQRKFDGKIKDNENKIKNNNKLNFSKSEKIIMNKSTNKSGNITKNENSNNNNNLNKDINLIIKDKDSQEKTIKNNVNSNKSTNDIFINCNKDKDKNKINEIKNEKHMKIDINKIEKNENKNGKDKSIEKNVIVKNEIFKKINTKNNKNIENLSLNKLTSNNDNILKDNINNNINKEKFSKTFYNYSQKDNNNINNIKMNFRNKNNNSNDKRDESSQFKGKKFTNVNNYILNKMISQNQKTAFKNSDYNINNIISFNSEEERRRKGKHYKILNERNIEAQRIQKMVNNLRSYIDNYNNNLEEFNNTTRNISYKNGKNFILKKINSNNTYIRNNSQIGSNSQKNKNNIIKLK